MENNPVLKCENLVVGYHRRGLCQKIDLTLKEGQLLFVKGGNGTGKSTLLRTLANDILPVKGGYQWFVPPASISWLPQSANTELQFSYTMGEILDIYNVFEQYRAFLPDTFESKKWKDSSRGEKQATLILSRLKRDTKVLVLDEPFNHVSREGIGSIEKLLEGIFGNNPKFSIVLVSHKLVTIRGFDTKVLQF